VYLKEVNFWILSHAGKNMVSIKWLELMGCLVYGTMVVFTSDAFQTPRKLGTRSIKQRVTDPRFVEGELTKNIFAAMESSFTMNRIFAKTTRKNTDSTKHQSSICNLSRIGDQEVEDEGDNRSQTQRIGKEFTTSGTTFDRRRFFHTIGSSAALAGTLLNHPGNASGRGLVMFPCKTPLANKYHIMRTGTSLLEEDDIWSTNALFLTNREAALSSKGIEQVRAACEMMRAKDTVPSLVKYGLPASSMDTANIVSETLKIGKDRLVPEFTFLDPRAIGRWDAFSYSETYPAVWAMDVLEAGPNGMEGRPPPNDDGTPNDTLADQMIRLRQVLSILESQFSGETVLLIFPDGTGPAVLSAMIAGIPLDRVHEIELKPGEIRFDVTMDNILQFWKIKQQQLQEDESSEYQATIIKGRQELERLRSNTSDDIVSRKDKKMEDERIEIDRRQSELKKARLGKEESSRLEREDRMRRIEAERLEKVQKEQQERQERQKEIEAVRIEVRIEKEEKQREEVQRRTEAVRLQREEREQQGRERRVAEQKLQLEQKQQRQDQLFTQNGNSGDSDLFFGLSPVTIGGSVAALVVGATGVAISQGGGLDDGASSVAKQVPGQLSTDGGDYKSEISLQKESTEKVPVTSVTNQKEALAHKISANIDTIGDKSRATTERINSVNATQSELASVMDQKEAMADETSVNADTTGDESRATTEISVNAANSEVTNATNAKESLVNKTSASVDADDDEKMLTIETNDTKEKGEAALSEEDEKHHQNDVTTTVALSTSFVDVGVGINVVEIAPQRFERGVHKDIESDLGPPPEIQQQLPNPVDPYETAEKAMQEYMNEDDGGEAWLSLISDLAQGDDSP